MDLVSAELPARTLEVAIDPERGLIGELAPLPTLREGDRAAKLATYRAFPPMELGEFKPPTSWVRSKEVNQREVAQA